jgi:TRAP transporter TAXI family solute receptor
MKKVNKKILIIFLCLLFLTSCQKEQEVVRIPTASTSGALYGLGYSLAQNWSKDIEGARFFSEASNGGIDNLNIIYDKDAEVSLGVSSIIYQAYHGEDVFKGRENKKIRVIAGLYLNPNQVVVKENENINSIEDLKGKNFSSGAPGSTTESETLAHLDVAGVGQNQLKLQSVAPSESAELMRVGKLDGVWIMSAAPAASITEITTSADAKVLEISKDFIEKLKVKYPWYTSYTIKAGTYNNDEDINTSAIKMLLYTTSDLDDELVYQMTKSFWENKDQLAENNKSLKEVDIKDCLKDIADLPVADGAMRYYREIGLVK